MWNSDVRDLPCHLHVEFRCQDLSPAIKKSGVAHIFQKRTDYLLTSAWLLTCGKAAI